MKIYYFDKWIRKIFQITFASHRTYESQCTNCNVLEKCTNVNCIALFNTEMLWMDCDTSDITFATKTYNLSSFCVISILRQHENRSLIGYSIYSTETLNSDNLSFVLVMINFKRYTLHTCISKFLRFF